MWGRLCGFQGFTELMCMFKHTHTAKSVWHFTNCTNKRTFTLVYTKVCYRMADWLQSCMYVVFDVFLTSHMLWFLLLFQIMSFKSCTCWHISAFKMSKTSFYEWFLPWIFFLLLAFNSQLIIILNCQPPRYPEKTANIPVLFWMCTLKVTHSNHVFYIIFALIVRKWKFL